MRPQIAAVGQDRAGPSDSKRASSKAQCSAGRVSIQIGVVARTWLALLEGGDTHAG